MINVSYITVFPTHSELTANERASFAHNLVSPLEQTAYYAQMNYINIAKKLQLFNFHNTVFYGRKF
jgi:lysine/ornithine N-monooxygenase